MSALNQRLLFGGTLDGLELGEQILDQRRAAISSGRAPPLPAAGIGP